LQTFGWFGPIADGTVEWRTETGIALLGQEYPLAQLKRWEMTDVLAVATGEFGHPVILGISVIPDD
jgi:hypothetical protein